MPASTKAAGRACGSGAATTGTGEGAGTSAKRPAMVSWNDSWKLPAMEMTRFGPANSRRCSRRSSSGSKERTVSGVPRMGRLRAWPP